MIPIICVRCDDSIKPGEPYDTHLHHAANWAGHTTYAHKHCPDAGVSRTSGHPPQRPAQAE